MKSFFSFTVLLWKEISETADTAVLELCGYESDPDETKNLAAK